MGDKLCGEAFSGETNFSGRQTLWRSTCSWERTSAQHKERGRSNKTKNSLSMGERIGAAPDAGREAVQTQGERPFKQNENISSISLSSQRAKYREKMTEERRGVASTATIDEAVATISFLAMPSTTMPTFFPAAVDGAVLYASSTRDAVVAVARYTGEQRRRWIRGPAMIP